MVVPYIEAGFFGSIPLALVEKVIIVTMSEDKISEAVRQNQYMMRTYEK
jgi:hypothetical protein